MEQLILSNYIKYKTPVAVILVITVFVMTLLRLIDSPVPCAHVESCDHFTVKLHETLLALFCLNESSSNLLHVKILNPNQCLETSMLSRTQSVTLYKAFNECFYNATFLCNPARLESVDNESYSCSFSQEIDFIKLCFDKSRLLSGIILNNNLFLYPQDAYHLHLYLKALLHY